MSRQAKLRPPVVRLHAATLAPATTADQLAAALTAVEAMPERRRAAESAVYDSARRRYTMLTGADWREAQQPDQATAWVESDHRYRERQTPEGYEAQCSCGERLAPAPGLGPIERTAWHMEHRMGVPA